MEKIKPAPSIITIFGATGNLSHLKLIPSLYELEKGGYLPEKFAILGAARKKINTAQFVESLLSSVQKNTRSGVDVASWDAFSKKIDFYCVDFDNEKDFAGLKEKLDKLEKDWGVCFTRIFYLATAPSFFPIIFEAAKKYKLNLGCDVHKKPARIVIEKPFGQDLPSAKKLNKQLDQVFDEDQIYRIDHFLAKETVQNILAFRFANEIFEPILNNKYVDHIQIAQAEDIGIETRGGYYEEAGALRDMIQNHLLQVLAVTCMDEPKKFDAASIRREKVNLLKNVRTIKPNEVSKYIIRGQYGSGKISGEQVMGYRREEKVKPSSVTETFVAAKLSIDNDCWKGVPIYMKHGKRLEKKLTSITIAFKEAGHALFSHLPKKPAANILTFQIQPDEGIGLRLVAKKPGLKIEVADVDMEFCYASAFREPLPDAYERLLLDVMIGDQTLFPHVDEVIRSWEIVDNILKGWEALPAPKFPNYTAGSWGPKEADKLIENDGRNWLAHQLSVCQIHFR
jgi:glucose-6-phosphate 1-dehydrogenase